MHHATYSINMLPAAPAACCAHDSPSGSRLQDRVARNSRNRQDRSPRSAQTGMTLLELIIACAILMILATAAMPVARYTVKREKEAELRRDLREMRDAIDRYKDDADKNLIKVEVGTEGYPPDLETLVNGVDVAQSATGAATAIGGLTTSTNGGFANPANPASNTSQQGFGTGPASGNGGPASGNADATEPKKVRFLRRIPVDPMTGRAQWGLRSVQDDPTSQSWGGKNVFDVFSLSVGTGLDNTKYSEW